MSDDSVKICNTIIQEEEYYSSKEDDYISKKNDLNSKYKNSLIGIVVTSIFFLILIILGIILLVIKRKKSKNSKIDVKKILAIILFIIAFLCAVSSVGLGYFTNKNKNEIDRLVEPIIDDKYRPCYSSIQKKLITDQVEQLKNINQLGVDLSSFGVGGSTGSFVYSEDSSNMQDASGNSLISNLNRDNILSYSARTSSESGDESPTILWVIKNTQDSSTGDTTSQVDLSLL